jgi:Cu+-exporting ATPase
MTICRRKARVGDATVAIGNGKFMNRLGAEDADLANAAEVHRAEGQTVMFVAIDGRPAGIIGVADPIKDSTPDAIRMLHEAGLRLRGLNL